MRVTRKHKPSRFTATGANERDEIASTTVNRFKTVRPYVLLAHLYLMTRHQGDHKGAETQQDKKEYASLTDLLMHASAMVMTPDFRRTALLAMNEANANKLVRLGPLTDEKDETYCLTPEGLLFLKAGHKRRLAMQHRKPKVAPEYICRHCAIDEIDEWQDLVDEERTRNQFDSCVRPTEFVDKFMQSVREKIIYKSGNVAPVWAGLIM